MIRADAWTAPGWEAYSWGMRDWLSSLNLVEPITIALARLGETLGHYLPRVLGAIGVLLLGWLLARGFRAVTSRLIARWERLAVVAPLRRELVSSGLAAVLPKTIAAIVFWGVILASFAVVGEMLGLRIVTAGFAHLAAALPNVLVAVIVVLGGFVLGNIARDGVTRAAAAARVRRPDLVGGAARIAMLLAAGILGLGQLGIDSTLLVSGISIGLGALLGSLALAFALGAKDTVGHIIALHYVAQSYRIGDAVQIGDVEGRIVELRTTAVVLDTPDGRTSIPASRFAEVPTTLRPER